MKKLMYIGGKWSEGSSGSWIEVEDPSNAEIVGAVAAASRRDVDQAVSAAREAFDRGPWPRLGVRERAARLVDLAEALTRRMPELVDLAVREAGCPRRMSEFMQVGTAIGHLYEFADLAISVAETRSIGLDERFALSHSELVYEPIGVCVGFSPFNFPLFMNIWKMAPALAMGNTIILKPSPLTPISAAVLMEACEEVAFPPGVVNLVNGDADIGEALVTHPGVDFVSFTGSTQVGRKIMASAAPTLKRLTLELGGKSPSLLLEDCDLDFALQGALFSAYFHAGQACVAGSRLLVPESRYDEITNKLVSLVTAMQVGPADSYETDIGPVVSQAQLERTEEYVRLGVSEGAKVLVGGTRVEGKGYFFEPTVMVECTNDMRIGQEEIFGPVLCVLPYQSVEQAIQLANDTPYGLAGMVWGSDTKTAREVARRIRAGTVWVNDFGVVSPRIPFGGYKQSGVGREMGAEGMLAFTETKHLYTALDQDLDSRAFSMACAAW